MKPLRILIATNHYGEHIRELPLAAELAEAFARAGHHVQVVATSWSSPPGAAPRKYREASGVEVLFLTPRLIGGMGSIIRRITKWIATPISSYFSAKRELAGEQYDLLVGFTPAVTSAGPFLWGLRHARKSLLWIPDFFPFHHRLLKQIPGGPPFEIARLAETVLYRRFDVLGCYTADAINYLKSHYPLKSEQTAEWIPVWGNTSPPPPQDRDEVRARYGLPDDRTIVVFGGQIEVGRGIPDILDAALLAAAAQPELYFLFVGGGSLTGLVQASIDAGAGNVGLIGTVPREEYFTIIAACDVGIVATVADLNIPAFPSKTWDYLRAGLPVAASVEFPQEQGEADYSRFVDEAGFGRAVRAGDPEGLVKCIASIVDDPAIMVQMRIRGKAALEEFHDVGKNAARILKATGLA